MKLGDLLRDARIKMGLSQFEIAKKIDVSTMFISMLESGKSKIPKRRIKAFSEVLKIDEDKLRNAALLEVMTNFKKDSK